MKGDRLGEFEELLLLGLQALRENTSVVQVQQYLERVAVREISLGAVYAGLDRLEAKGFVRSNLGEPVRERGGKRKRLFSVTREGKRIAQDVRRQREALWQLIEQKR